MRSERHCGNLRIEVAKKKKKRYVHQVKWRLEPGNASWRLAGRLLGEAATLPAGVLLLPAVVFDHVGKLDDELALLVLLRQLIGVLLYAVFVVVIVLILLLF